MKIAGEIEKLAAQESEVRQLEMLIERVRSLNDKDFAELLSSLGAAAADTVCDGGVASGLTERGRQPPGEPPLAATEAAAMLLRRFTSLLKIQPAR